MTKWFGMVFLVGFVLVFGSFNRFAIGPDQMLGPYTATLALIIPFVFDATKDLRFDRILGELSYAIYVAHFIVWKTLAWLTGPPGAIVYFAVLILFAAVILRAVEMPIERLRKNRYARACEVASPAP